MSLFQYFLKIMKTNKPSREKPRNQEKNTNKLSWWKKVATVTSIAFAWLFASCDKVPRNQIILNPKEKTEQFSFEYHIWWSNDPIVIDYNITIYQDWDTYKWLINQGDWWFSTETTIESNSIDGLFEEISNKTDSEDITEDTKSRRDAKIAFAKQVYEDSILNNKNPSEEITKIKYKHK